MTKTSWALTEKPVEAEDRELIKRRACCDPLLVEQHSSAVLDNDHPGVEAAKSNDPKGWKITLQHVLERSLDGTTSGLRPAPLGWACRGENQEYPTMRSSLHRWTHCRTVVTPPRPMNTEELEGWQSEILSFLARNWNASDLAEDRIRMVLRNNPFIIELMPKDSEIRRFVFQIQHHGGPTIWLDWTRDVRVALYFACRGGNPTRNGRVWLAEVSMGGGLSPGIIDMLKFFDGVFVEPLHDDPKDDRLRVQSSVFLFFKNGGAVWRDEHANRVRGISIPASHKLPILHELCEQGVSDSSLFPPMGRNLKPAVYRLNRANLGMRIGSD